MGIIDSPQNQHVKLLRSLQKAKERRRQGAFLAEGARLIAEALDVGWPLVAAAVCPELLGPAAEEVAGRLRAGDWPCHEMTERAFRALSAEQEPQGVAVAARQRTARLADLRPGPRDVLVVAWELRDPGNMGSLIRTAEFLGCRALVAVGDCVDLFDPKTVRATAGAVFRLPVAPATSEELLSWAGEAGVSLVASEAEGGRTPAKLRLRGPVVLIVGSEAHGLPAEVKERADELVTVPRRGGVESLNAVVAVGICVYGIVTELNRQPRGSEGEE